MSLVNLNGLKKTCSKNDNLYQTLNWALLIPYSFPLDHTNFNFLHYLKILNHDFQFIWSFYLELKVIKSIYYCSNNFEDFETFFVMSAITIF